MYRVTELRAAEERAQLAGQQGQPWKARQDHPSCLWEGAAPRKALGNGLPLQKFRNLSLKQAHTHTEEHGATYIL